METIDVLESYSNEFRKLINSRVSEQGETKDLFGLTTPEDWGYICTSMDIVGQTNEAIRNFLQFGLEGPTKYENKGEQYLRLYGVLNATYLQQEAIKQIRKRFGLEADEIVNTIPIRDIRNKIGAHSPSQGYRSEKKIAYVAVRALLSNFSFSYGFKKTRDIETFTREEVDLKERVEEHCRTIINVLDRIYEALIKRFWQKNDSQYDEHMTELEDLRIKRDGGEVLRSGGGKFRMPADGQWTVEMPLRDR